MLMSESSESKELIPAEMLMCVSFTSSEWPSTVWEAGINPLNFSVCTKSRFCICCDVDTFIGAK